MKDSLNKMYERFESGKKAFDSSDIFKKTDLVKSEKGDSEDLFIPEFHPKVMRKIEEIGINAIWQCLECKKLFTIFINSKEPKCKCK